MLPNLGRLNLQRVVHTGAPGDDEAEKVVIDLTGSPQKKKHRPASASSSSAHAPAPAPAAASAPSFVPSVPVYDMPEEDDESEDIGYRKIVQKRNVDANVMRETKRWHLYHKFDTVYRLAKQDIDLLMQGIIQFDEPPCRYLFSSLGLSPTTGSPDGIRFMMLDQNSSFKVNDGTMSAFDALQDLRVRFANKPSHYNNRNLCGTSNCFEAGVRTDGQEKWSIALRAVLLAIDAGTHGTNRWQGGATLPTTVSIRAPKASTFKDKDGIDGWVHANDARDELALTLRAARMQLCPPVYAAIPVKIFSEPLRTVYSRDVAYVFESGWLNFFDLLGNLHVVHKDSDKLAEAKENIARETNTVLKAISSKKGAGWFFMDIKYANIVARRKAKTTEYDVRFIDFAALWTGDANRHRKEVNSSDNIYFINGLLFLNELAAWHRDHMAMFKPLAEMVIGAWYTMDVEDGSLCALIKQDHNRVLAKACPRALSLSRTKTLDEHHKLLRGAFYQMIQNYGERGRLLKQADQSTEGGPSFLERFVRAVEEAYTNA